MLRYSVFALVACGSLTKGTVDLSARCAMDADCPAVPVDQRLTFMQYGFTQGQSDLHAKGRLFLPGHAVMERDINTLNMLRPADDGGVGVLLDAGDEVEAEMQPHPSKSTTYFYDASFAVNGIPLD